MMSIHTRRLFFFQAEDGIRDLVRSRGLGDVYKRQVVFTAGAGVVALLRQRRRSKNKEGKA